MPSFNNLAASITYGGYVLQRQRRGGRGAVPGRREPPDRAHGKASTRSRPYPAPLGAPWSQGRAKQGCSPSTGGSAFASRSVPSSSSWSLGSRSYSLEQGTCRFASARSYMMVECYYLLGSASSRRLVWAASRCKLSLRPGGWLYQAMLLLTRACSRSARSGGEGRVSACVSDDRACAARQPDNQAVLPARAYVRYRRPSQIFASLSLAHDTLLRDTVPRRSAQRRHGVGGADRWRTSCLFSCCRAAVAAAAAARAGPGTNHQLLPTCKTRRARRSLRHVCSRTLLRHLG